VAVALPSRLRNASKGKNEAERSKQASTTADQKTERKKGETASRPVKRGDTTKCTPTNDINGYFLYVIHLLVEFAHLLGSGCAQLFSIVQKVTVHVITKNTHKGAVLCELVLLFFEFLQTRKNTGTSNQVKKKKKKKKKNAYTYTWTQKATSKPTQHKKNKNTSFAPLHIPETSPPMRLLCRRATRTPRRSDRRLWPTPRR
jgi:hypothetical protein